MHHLGINQFIDNKVHSSILVRLFKDQYITTTFISISVCIFQEDDPKLPMVKSLMLKGNWEISI